MKKYKLIACYKIITVDKLIANKMTIECDDSIITLSCHLRKYRRGING
jgi:hypothetical protein